MMRPADRAQALEFVAQLTQASAAYYPGPGPLMHSAADIITALLAHIDALTPMARAWAEDRQTFASLSAPVGVYFMDPAEDL